MSLGLLVVAAVCVVNPWRVASALPRGERVLVGALGALASWLVLVGVALGAEAVLDLLDAAASTARMGVGVTLLLQGGLLAVVAPPRPEPSLAGRRAALVPVAFPVTLTPGLALLTLSAAADRSAPVALGAMAGALALVPLAALLVGPAAPEGARARVAVGLARLTAAGSILVGAALIVNGVYDL